MAEMISALMKCRTRQPSQYSTAARSQEVCTQPEKCRSTQRKKQEEHRGRTSTWGSPSFGGASTESRQLSIANKTRSFPGVGRGTLDTIDAIISHNGLL